MSLRTPQLISQSSSLISGKFLSTVFYYIWKTPSSTWRLCLRDSESFSFFVWFWPFRLPEEKYNDLCVKHILCFWNPESMQYALCRFIVCIKYYLSFFVFSPLLSWIPAQEWMKKVQKASKLFVVMSDLSIADTQLWPVLTKVWTT